MQITKTIFAGLDNAGKTTIVKFLQKKLTLNTESIPTKKADTSSQDFKLLGLQMSYWDLGGQEQYRLKYFNKKKGYFLGVGTLIYVIDAKDISRYDVALDYLKRILSTLKEANNDTMINIFFHKLDSDIFFDDMETINKNCKDLLQTIIDFKIFPNVSFYNTSIYNSISILRAFSEITSKLNGNHQLLRTLLNNYCKETSSHTALLFDTYNFIVEGNIEKLDVLEVVAENYAIGIEKLDELNVDSLNNVLKVNFVQETGGKSQAVIFIHVLNNDPRVYLITLAIEPKSVDLLHESLEILKNKLLELMQVQ